MVKMQPVEVFRNSPFIQLVNELRSQWSHGSTQSLREHIPNGIKYNFQTAIANIQHGYPWYAAA